MSYKFSEPKITWIDYRDHESRCHLTFESTQHTLATVQYVISFGLSLEQLLKSAQGATPEITLRVNSPNKPAAHYLRALDEQMTALKQGHIFHKLVKQVISDASAAPNGPVLRAPKWLVERAISVLETDERNMVADITNKKIAIRALEADQVACAKTISSLKDIEKNFLSKKDLIAKKTAAAASAGHWIIDKVHNGRDRDLIAYAPLQKDSGVFVTVDQSGVVSFGEYTDMLGDSITDAFFDRPLWTVSCSDFETALDIAVTKFKFVI